MKELPTCQVPCVTTGFPCKSRAARQLEDGRWACRMHDPEHSKNKRNRLNCVSEEGNRYGALKVVRRDPTPNQPSGALWICKCEICGAEESWLGTQLRARSKAQENLACRECMTRRRRAMRAFQRSNG